jgi:hypothetical protein
MSVESSVQHVGSAEEEGVISRTVAVKYRWNSWVSKICPALSRHFLLFGSHVPSASGWEILSGRDPDHTDRIAAEIHSGQHLVTQLCAKVSQHLLLRAL